MRQDDLVILTPDGAYKEVLTAILPRPDSLGTREIRFRIVLDPLHDSSPQAVQLLMPFQRNYRHALMLRDFAGSGVERRMTPQELEAQMEKALQASGWAAGQARVVVAAPEIEDWLRIPSAQLRSRLRTLATKNAGELDEAWAELVGSVVAECGGRAAHGKPQQPKESFERLLEHFGVHPSNAHYRALAEKESLRHCVSPSFQRLLKILQTWFPVT